MDTEGIFKVQVTEEGSEEFETEEILLVPRRRVRPQTQMRKTFDMDELKDLGSSIKALRNIGGGIAGTGILHPLIGVWESGAVLPNGEIKPDANILINTGESRWRATEFAGFGPDDLLPFVVGDKSKRVRTLTMLVENLQRSNVKPMETAIALADYAKENKLTMQGVADEIGRPFWWVQKFMGLLDATPLALKILEDDPESVEMVVRVSRIKNERLAKLLVDLKLDDNSFTAVRPLLKWDKLSDGFTDELIGKVKDAWKHAKQQKKPIDWTQLHPQLRRFQVESGHLEALGKNDWKPADLAATDAKPKQQDDRIQPRGFGARNRVVSQFDVELALGSVLRQLTTTGENLAEVDAIAKPKLCMNHLDEIESLVRGLRLRLVEINTPRPRGRPKKES